MANGRYTMMTYTNNLCEEHGKLEEWNIINGSLCTNTVDVHKS